MMLCVRVYADKTTRVAETQQRVGLGKERQEQELAIPYLTST